MLCAQTKKKKLKLKLRKANLDKRLRRRLYKRKELKTNIMSEKTASNIRPQS